MGHIRSHLLLGSPMIFLPCDTIFESKTPDGVVLQRVCLDEKATTCKKVVTPGMCRRCKSKDTTDTLPLLGKAKSPDDRQMPSIFRRATTYAEAIIEWTAAGRPERSQDEIDNIYDTYCSRCKRFNPENQRCLDCGCRVSNKGLAIFNKIRMATEHCPKGKW